MNNHPFLGDLHQQINMLNLFKSHSNREKKTCIYIEIDFNLPQIEIILSDWFAVFLPYLSKR